MLVFLILPSRCAALAAGCSLPEWSRCRRGSTGWSPSPPPRCLRRSRRAGGWSSSRPASSGLCSNLFLKLNTHKSFTTVLETCTCPNLCGDNLTRWQCGKMNPSEQLSIPSVASNTGFCYDLVEKHKNGGPKAFFFFKFPSCSVVCMSASESVKGAKRAAHRGWPLVWCSWCRLRTWRRCHFQLCLILSAWRPVWDTWADGWREGGGERGVGDSVRRNHLDSINTWTAAQLALKTCYTLALRLAARTPRSHL